MIGGSKVLLEALEASDKYQFRANLLLFFWGDISGGVYRGLFMEERIYLNLFVARWIHYVKLLIGWILE